MVFELGMVLSGGGARGLGHVGVLKALAEEGVSPQTLAGTSAGAIVAALEAAGYSADEMLEFFVEKSPFRLSKLALTKPGIFDTEKVVADFLEYFPEDSFAALGKPIFLTATDLVEGRPVILAEGRLIPAVLASASTPLVFTPTEIDGRWYSDGGITNNFPTEPLVGRCAVVLGVYVSAVRPRERSDMKTPLAITHRALEIAMYHGSRDKFSQCDLVICPPELSRFGAFDTKHLAEIVDIGYRAARDRMDDILAVLDGGRRGAPR